GILGTFLVLRRRALASDALSHATLPGITTAFLIALAVGWNPRSLPLLLAGALISGLFGVAVLQALARWTRLTEDTATGIVLSVFFGIGIVMLSHIQSLDAGGQAGLKSFILGQTAAMSARDVQIITVFAALAVAVVLLLFKEFRLVIFDPAFAREQGWPVQFLDLVLMALVALVVVLGLQAVGLLLSVALLVIPACAARFWTDRLSVMVFLAGLIGALSGYTGTALSSLFPDIPTGAIIVLVAGVLFLASFLAHTVRRRTAS
ncbi:MAG: metal ABC transporter permease, partial [Pseudomonadota bacterium]|nr:metal ABC transporter permease [Pseudomonadota bacterium]